MPKKIPVRQCAACREKREKRDLLRVVRTPEGQVVFDPRGKVSGRGVYICRSRQCLERAIKSRVFERTLELPLPEETVQALREQTEVSDADA